MKGGGKRERASSKSNSGPGGRADTSAGREPPASAESATVEMARQLAAIVETHALAELVIDTPELTMTLRRGPGWVASSGAPTHLVAPNYATAPATMAAPSSSAPRAPDAPAPSHGQVPAPAAAPAKPEPDYHVVTSPFVGTFYRSPGPDSDPYVVEGQRVDKGQVLCIVEAMKLMNEIEADMAGVIAAVLVENTQPVEYGQPLFRLAPP
jgi:acetyl-CoA carboxylase biotin carboxyl carrier protein